MQNKRKLVGALLAVLSSMLVAAPAFAYDSDYNYIFETKNPDEFVTINKTHVNYDGEIPDYLLNIYDFSPQPVYTSEYGTTIAEPIKQQANYSTYAPYTSPVSNTFTQSPNSLLDGTTQNGNQYVSGGTNNTLPDYTYNDAKQYPLTPIEDVPKQGWQYWNAENISYQFIGYSL